MGAASAAATPSRGAETNGPSDPSHKRLRLDALVNHQCPPWYSTNGTVSYASGVTATRSSERKKGRRSVFLGSLIDTVNAGSVRLAIFRVPK